MSGQSAERAQWFPDDQQGYSIALCVCEDGPYLGARQMGTPCRCERCGRLTPEQWDFLVERVAANLRKQYEASQGALSDLLAENTENVTAVREALESLDDLCAAEERHGDSIRAHEVRGAVSDLRALVAPGQQATS